MRSLHNYSYYLTFRDGLAIGISHAEVSMAYADLSMARHPSENLSGQALYEYYADHAG